MTSNADSSMSKETAGSIALALGPAVALLVAGVLSGARGTIGDTNVALTLACIVALAAVAGRRAGFATAIVAAISYNFFHTQPYRSLRIHDAKDVITVLLLAALGIVVSETAHRRREAKLMAKSHLRGEHALERIASLLVQDPDPDVLWTQLQPAFVDLLDLTECRFETGESCDLPALPHSGSLFSKEMPWGRGGFQLPEAGAALTISFQGHTYGHVGMVPRANAGCSFEARRVAVALGDLFAFALAFDRSDGHESAPNTPKPG